MSQQVIEGMWEEVIQRHDLRGRRVRVIVVDDAGTGAGHTTGSLWVRQLREWAESHPRVGHAVDDSRESIYGGTVDDPR